MTRAKVEVERMITETEEFIKCDGCDTEIEDEHEHVEYTSPDADPIHFHDECAAEVGVITHPPEVTPRSTVNAWFAFTGWHVVSAMLGALALAVGLGMIASISGGSLLWIILGVVILAATMMSASAASLKTVEAANTRKVKREIRKEKRKLREMYLDERRMRGVKSSSNTGPLTVTPDLKERYRSELQREMMRRR